MFNRLPLHFIVPSVPPIPLLATAHTIKLSMLRCRPDEDGEQNLIVEYEVGGSLDEDDSELLAQLLSQFKVTPQAEGGAA